MEVSALSAAAWLQVRVKGLEDRVACLASELAAQETSQLVVRAQRHRETEGALEVQIAAEVEAAREAHVELGTVHGASEQLRTGNAELSNTRCRLLHEIDAQRRIIGDLAAEADQHNKVKAHHAGALSGVARHNHALRRSLAELEEAQKRGEIEEVAERDQRRELRRIIREEMDEEARLRDERARRLAGRDEELALWRGRAEAACEAERRAQEEAEQLRRQTMYREAIMVPTQLQQCQELEQDLRHEASLEARLRAELIEVRETLHRRRQKSLEASVGGSATVGTARGGA